jgi:hypothetical protein
MKFTVIYCANQKHKSRPQAAGALRCQEDRGDLREYDGRGTLEAMGVAQDPLGIERIGLFEPARNTGDFDNAQKKSRQREKAGESNIVMSRSMNDEQQQEADHQSDRGSGSQRILSAVNLQVV